MTLTFLGTGTSTGVPMIGCRCPVCTSPDPRNRRRRASVLIREGERAWLIDAGPDFRAQALDAGLERLEGVLLTHAHADHVLGLDDLRPVSWRQPVPVWADEATTATVRAMFPYFFSQTRSLSSRPRLDFQALQAGQAVDAAGLAVLPVAIRHGEGQILGFRLGPLAYLTDCNGVPPATRDLLAGIETLVVGALRAESHPTHFTIEQAIAAGRDLGAARIYLTHFSHNVDHGPWSEGLPAGVELAYDGLTLTFTPADPQAKKNRA